MTQIFRPRANTIARASLGAALPLLALGGWATYAVWWSPYVTGQHQPREQIVPFSHQHHVTALGIDCRYCHVSVTDSSFAGIPPTETCMTCHSQIYTEEPMLAPVRESLATGVPLSWNRVHDLPDFVFFNHQIHVAKGVGCATCHGPVHRMPLVWSENPLYMKWCLECHRNPAQFLRPREEVFNMNWRSPTNQLAAGAALIERYNVNTPHLIECSACHR